MSGLMHFSQWVLYKSRFIGVNITNLQQIVSVFELYRKLLGDNAPVRDRHCPFSFLSVIRFYFECFPDCDIHIPNHRQDRFQSGIPNLYRMNGYVCGTLPGWTVYFQGCSSPSFWKRTGLIGSVSEKVTAIPLFSWTIRGGNIPSLGVRFQISLFHNPDNNLLLLFWIPPLKEPFHPWWKSRQVLCT